MAQGQGQYTSVGQLRQAQQLQQQQQMSGQMQMQMPDAAAMQAQAYYGYPNYAAQGGRGQYASWPANMPGGGGGMPVGQMPLAPGIQGQKTGPR